MYHGDVLLIYMVVEKNTATSFCLVNYLLELCICGMTVF